MNKQDTLIVALLFAALLGWMFHQQRTNARQLAERRALASQAQPAQTPQSGDARPDDDASPAPAQPVGDGHAATGTTATAIEAVAPDAAGDEESAADTPATEVILRSAELELVVSSRGGSIVSASLPEFPAVAGRNRDPVRLSFAPRPALVLEGLAGLGAAADFELDAAPDGRSVRVRRTTAAGLRFERTIELRPRCEVAVSDRLLNPGDRSVTLPTNFVAIGTMYRGTSKNDTLGADALPVGLKTKPDHWESRLPGLFTGRNASSFGCTGSGPSSAALPVTRTADVAAPQEWLALKSRFFALVYAGSTTNAGFRLTVDRDTVNPTLTLERVSASVAYTGQVLDPGMVLERNTTLYIGPKRLSYLWAQGHRHHEIMQFGWLKWVCMVLVPTLNAFHRLIPNYGVAVILLTVLVRVLFWPLTHKSTESMKRMQALQPQLKAIQKEFKESPQKVQQETWRVYRENKVNPMSSCLPTLVQIPVFIALYTVLRSAVELRFASFLWIADLSEPENLLAGLLPSPIHSLNILPLFMAATMVWQTSLTPTMGDPAQQKMMMWMMPAMMLFMFYPMPSGLVLYWTVSQMLSIAQLLWQRRSNPPAGGLAAAAGVDAAGATQAMTRQMRRRAER